MTLHYPKTEVTIGDLGMGRREPSILVSPKEALMASGSLIKTALTLSVTDGFPSESDYIQCLKTSK